MLPERKWMRFYARMSGVVMGKVLLIAGGAYLGQILDKKMGTYPLFLFLLVTICLALGIVWVIWVVDQEMKE